MITSDDTPVEADVCIVGAGPVGLALAHALAEAGHGVVILESGGDDAPLDAPELDDPLDAVVDADGFEPLWSSRSRGVGGTSRIWNTVVARARAAKYVPLEPLDLEARPGVPHTGWPFDMTVLEPWLREASDLCGLHPAVWTRGSEPRLGGGGALECRLYAFGPRARFTEVLASRVRNHPHVTFRTHATVVGFDTSDDGARVEAVRWIGPGDRLDPLGAGRTAGGSVRARCVVLAAGTVENARLLLWTARHGGVPWARADWLGRGFMEHPVDRSLELVTRASLLCPDAGFFGPHQVPGGSGEEAAGAPSRWRMGRLGLPPDLLRAEGLPNLSLRFTTQEAGAAVLDAPRSRSWGRRLVPTATLRRAIGNGVRRLARESRRFRGVTYRLSVDLEQWPDPGNRVTLSPELDGQGLPRARLHWRWRAEDEARRRRLLDLVSSALERASLGSLRREPELPLNPDAHHHAGTARMHADPGQGVVDPDLKVHDTHNLFVCGAAVFPTAGVANPTLTALALALRLGAHLDRGLGTR